jgi:tetratricopeptide (TPR) repeat protein
VGDASAVLVGGSSGQGYADRIISDMQARLASDSSDYVALSRLGAAYLQKARDTNDPSFYAQAENALKKALDIKPDDYDALTAMGSLELSRHEFAIALDWGRKAKEVNPNKSLAYGVIGDAQVELGRYDEAIETFQQMVDLRPDLSSYSRVSYARELYGDVEGAIEAMRMAVNAGSPAAENTVWCRMQLGNLLFNSNQLEKAEQEYKTALGAYPGYLHALAGLAQIEAARGNLDEAINLYEQATGSVPLPQYLTALGDLYTIKGDAKAAQEEHDTVLYIFKLFEANGVDAGIEKAAFLADRGVDAAEAVKLAQDAATTRQDVHTLDTLAWSLYRAGRYEEALEAEKSAMRLGTQNPLFFFHLGMIYEKLGDVDNARTNLQKALDINPHFSARHATDAAETLKALAR